MNILKSVLFFIAIINGSILLSQEQEKEYESVYTEFQRFFEKEIKYQGVKGNWIFGLNEITSIHKFDYNNDNLLDVLMEFNATPVDEGNYTNYYAVFFQNLGNERYKFVDYLDSFEISFVDYDNGIFRFINKNSNEIVKFKLEASKIVPID